jgi:SAM-dependent methyltransferase
MPLYSTLADWWPLLSSPAEYEDEADHYWAIIQRHTAREVTTLLELGCGGGNNASHLKSHARLTLTDLSPDMLRVSQRLNPECEHVQGDMRSLRLDRAFDAVLVHDAVMSMRTTEDLQAVAHTAHIHLAPGGVALFVPDCTAETFRPGTDHGGHDGTSEIGAQRALRYLEWSHDPDPNDTEFISDMVYIMRETIDGEDKLRVEHERHTYGLFSRDVWLQTIENADLEPASEPPTPRLEVGEVFIGRKPHA